MSAMHSYDWLRQGVSALHSYDWLRQVMNYEILRIVMIGYAKLWIDKNIIIFN